MTNYEEIANDKEKERIDDHLDSALVVVPTNIKEYETLERRRLINN